MINNNREKRNRKIDFVDDLREGKYLQNNRVITNREKILLEIVR